MGNNNYKNNNEGGLQINNNKNNSQYNLFFHFPLEHNDIINSIDIYDDKVAIGTIMGNAYLVRVDKNNLDVIENQEYISLKNNNNLILKQNSRQKNKNPFNKLNIYEEEINIKTYTNKKLNKKEEVKESQNIENTNDISKIKSVTKKIRMIRLNNSLKCSQVNNNSTSIKKGKINIKNIVIKNEERIKNNKLMMDVTNILDEDEKNNEIDIVNDKNKLVKEKDIEEKISQKNKEIKKFPQITQLLTKVNENICCINFDTDDILNVSIGDFEIIRIYGLKKFNKNDKNSKFEYDKFPNYKYSHKHFKYCENATCLMTSTRFLIIFTYYGDFKTDESCLENYKYNNIDLTEKSREQITKRPTIRTKIEMHKFSVPFDFDGTYYLYLDHISKDFRHICLYDTINHKSIRKYQITREFGHISHMKILRDRPLSDPGRGDDPSESSSKRQNILDKNLKIFLCRNDSQCEIYLLDDEFTCVESFEHIGDDIINIYIYYKESKLSDDFKQKIKINKKQNILNANNNIYENYIKINNNKTKSNNRINSDTNNNNESPKEKIKLEKQDVIPNVYAINDNNILNRNHLNLNNNESDKEIKEIKLHIKENSNNSSSRKDISIYDKKKLNEESKDYINDYSFGKKELRKQYNNLIKESKDQQYTIDIKEDKNETNYYIFTMDNNGNVNMYKNKTVKTLFNLYDIEGMDEIYKNKKFFSIGFPYYFTLNELYFAITTDYGLFVVSNKSKEL